MRRTLSTLAIVTLVTAGASGATLTYTGGDGGFWSVGANWDTGQVPTNGDDAVVPDVGVDTTSIVDVRGKVFHATTRPNLPAGADTGVLFPDNENQMYTVLADLPMIDIQYKNGMNNMGDGLGLLSNGRWRQTPNQGRNIDPTHPDADWSTLSDRYQIKSSYQNAHGNRTTKEQADPTTEAMVQFNMPDLDGDYDGVTTKPNVYIGHDRDLPKPTWLSSNYTDTGLDLDTNAEPGGHADPPTWDVYSMPINDFTPGTNDSRGWISDRWGEWCDGDHRDVLPLEDAPLPPEPEDEDLPGNTRAEEVVGL